jgi:AcrR family transcriptional regulator
MNISVLVKPPAKGDLTRDKLKRAARDLFARYGIDAVTIRDIAKNGDQKNGGSVNYYFGSKEELVVEILNDAAIAMDEMRGRNLAALLASKKSVTIRDILRLLTEVEPSHSEEQHRLLTMLQTYRRDLMHTEIPGRSDKNYQKCVDQLYQLLPDISHEVIKKRLYFLIPFLWTALATREGGEQRAEFWKELWADPSTMETLLDTAEGILVLQPSSDTLKAMRKHKREANVRAREHDSVTS